MQRAMTVDQAENAVDELLPLVVADLAEGDLTAQVIVAVGVAPRAMQRTLARDFDGERRTVATENPAPRGEQGPEQIFHRSIVCAPSMSGEGGP